ncbi:MAG: 50S ribosomal protein L11 methyltransferase [Pseudomonadota bacterium]|nr:50S ribosomal protein L11 methyltransferase [Pseudomonadota bacterium]
MNHELVLRAPQALVELVSDLLIDEAGALSVSVEDADADSDHEQPLFGEPDMPPPAAGWQRSTLRALFDDEATADAAAALALARHGSDGLHLQALAPLAEQDWVRLTQSQFTPVAITDTFWVVPSWHEPPAAARQVIRLDPGLAFGTGTHPTTRMCLRWLATRPRDVLQGRLLDYGCGSGILAIGAGLIANGSADTAARLAIDAVDIDPAAVHATLGNAEHNRVALNAGLPDTAHGRYDVVLANILATPLKLLAPLLAAQVAPGGSLVLAGILQRQADDLKAAYAPWLELVIDGHEDGWVLMTAQRPSAAAGA